MPPEWIVVTATGSVMMCLIIAVLGVHFGTKDDIPSILAWFTVVFILGFILATVIALISIPLHHEEEEEEEEDKKQT